MTEVLRVRRRGWFASAVAGVSCAAVVFAAAALAGGATSAQAASATSSAVTVTARQQDPDVASAPMPDLSVTVSQTENLISQGIRLTWTGGKKSIAPSSNNGGQNFLQIFMCWGDDPNDSTRPDRTTCVYGGANTPGATRDSFRNYAIDKVPAADRDYSALTGSAILPPYTAIPFRARDGKRVDGVVKDPGTGATSVNENVNVNVNEFFTNYSTNEIPWVGSGDDGTGSISFEVQTAAQSSALGCGNPTTSGSGGKGAGCWLVILPRGLSDNGTSSITQSGLFIDSWKHALSVRLGFEALGSRCPEGTAERLLAGSELASFAVNSWQPVVCNQTGGSVYSLLTIPESDALTAAATTDDAPLALTSYPLSTDAADPMKYAPIALTGISISLSIDRRPDPFKALPQSYVDAARTPFTSVNLTPRLLAKLLSYSYRSSLPTGADTSYLTGTNRSNITKDPDFLAVNDPEWAAQDLSGSAIADVIVPQGRSDAARAVWAYIAADVDARDFLAGKPDPWGMTVNPWYSTDESVNPSRTAFTLDRDDFPKADPIEYLPGGSGPINLVTWRPFANDLGSVAYATLRGDGQGPGLWDPNATPPKYAKATRMLPGQQALIGLTSTAAAGRYEVITASLQNPSGSFVAPTNDGMVAAADAMTAAGAGGSVLSFNQSSGPAKAKSAAYPLTMPVYAAANPMKSDALLRTTYANFIRYAVSASGQTPGVDIGQLPVGYASLPSAWAQQAIDAADAIERGAVDSTTTTPPPLGESYIPSQSSTSTSSVTAATAANAVASATSPAATGAATPTLASGITPNDPDTGWIAWAVPLSVLAGVLGATGLPVVSRLRRRIA